jgi:hypothetical protein
MLNKFIIHFFKKTYKIDNWIIISSLKSNTKVESVINIECKIFELYRKEYDLIKWLDIQVSLYVNPKKSFSNIEVTLPEESV